MGSPCIGTSLDPICPVTYDGSLLSRYIERNILAAVMADVPFVLIDIRYISHQVLRDFEVLKRPIEAMTLSKCSPRPLRHLFLHLMN
jgi:hypothetical protein